VFTEKRGFFSNPEKRKFASIQEPARLSSVNMTILEHKTRPEDAGAVYRDFHDRLRGFIAHRVPAGEVDDLLQEVFLRVHRGLDGLRDPEHLTAWLFQITRNVIQDYYRRRGRDGEILERSVSGAERELASRIDEREPVAAATGTGTPEPEFKTCLVPLIERLPEPYRAAVRIVDVEGVAQTAAAARLGLSVSGMKSRVQRGRARLRSLLGECCRVELNARDEFVDCEPRNTCDAGGGC
jgi:RNA polymerase sigma-70 factor (ECF subfamily)